MRPVLIAIARMTVLNLDPAMLNSDYLGDLFAGFWKYSRDTFGDADYFDRLPSDTDKRPPVFTPLYRDKNVLLRPGGPPVEHSAVLRALPRGKRHRHFASMRSSQALAQSVFGNLKIGKKLGCLLDLRDENGLSLFPIADSDSCSLEYELDYLGEAERAPTSVDVMFISGYRVAVECKLAENKFGPCSRPSLDENDPQFCDGTYSFQMNRRERCPLTTQGIRYWEYVPPLTTWPADREQDPCPLRLTYQLFRNLLAACISPAPSPKCDVSNGHVVVVSDERNPAFRPDGQARSVFTAMKKNLKDPSRLRACSWQQIRVAMRGDSQLHWLTDALHRKYGF